jgi:hypothetical protein
MLGDRRTDMISTLGVLFYFTKNVKQYEEKNKRLQISRYTEEVRQIGTVLLEYGSWTAHAARTKHSYRHRLGGGDPWITERKGFAQ